MAASGSIAITKALETVMRNDRGRLMAALIARLRDFQLAEEALQEAAISALSHWSRVGLPSSPQGWLLRVALRKAIDRIRARSREARKGADQAILAEEEGFEVADAATIPDERLRLVFTCCHPALEEKTRVALTLRTLCGLSTTEVAAVYLDAEPTMGQRLSRARSKILAAGIPYTVPGPEEWPARLNSVLTVIYLIFTQGHVLGPSSTRDLCGEAIYLARMVNHLRPDQPEVEGCLALLLLTEARAAARIGPQGETIALLDQDRSLWSRPMIDEGLALLDAAMARRKSGPYQIKAALAALHTATGRPDWIQIADLYEALLRYEPSPVIALNHAVAIAEGQGVENGLALIETLGGALQGYQPFHAARAEYLSRLGRVEEAGLAYDMAITLAPSDADRAFLIQRRAAMTAEKAV